MADFINNYDRDKLQVMFTRESDGIYFFGSKKIFVKVEQDKIISIFFFHNAFNVI
jgi:hypothetical protein